MLQIHTRTQTKRVYLYNHHRAQEGEEEKKKRKSFTAICSLFRSSEFMKANMSILFIYTDIYDYGIAMR
jgi:hypothetical protein